MKEDDIFTGKLNPRLILVSGESDSGKTTWCSDQVEDVQKRGFSVGGLLSPGIYRRGRKVGIELLNLATEEKRTLGELRPEEIHASPTKKWAMNFETLDWGNQVLRGMDYFDMIVVDELGPLEFLHQRGLLEAFDLIRRLQFKTALIVVRPNLLPAAKEIWSDFDIVVRTLVG